MDNQIIEMLRDRFGQLDAELCKLHGTLKEHVDLDALYWKKIDANEAKIDVLKWLFGIVSAAGTAIAGWLVGKH